MSGTVERAAARIGCLLLAQIVNPFLRPPSRLADEIVGERVGLLADQMHVVPLADQSATQALDVDVTPRAREHVPVGHDDPHSAPFWPLRVRISMLA